MKIIVRLPNWLGDVVMAIPFLFYLRQEFPAARILIVGKSPFLELLKILPLSLEGISFDKAQFAGLLGIGRFVRKETSLHEGDLFFVLPPSFSSGFMSFLCRAKRRVGYGGQFRGIFFQGGKDLLPRPENHRSQEYLHLLQSVTRRAYPDPKNISRTDLLAPLPPFFPCTDQRPFRYVVINPNSEASSRRLPLEKWGEVVKALPSTVTLVLIGAQKEEERVRELQTYLAENWQGKVENLAGKTTLRELAGLLVHAQGVITNDSGPAHLANLLGTPVAVFFGAGDSRNTAPVTFSGQVLVIKKDLTCSPCLKNVCPLGTLACLKELSLDEWSEKMLKIFSL